MKDDLGKRMKEQYEQRTRTYLPRRTYTLIRLDGKAFHTFTRRMNRPYDEEFIEVMDETAKFLASEIQGCQMAYVQSDEISLLLTDFSTITTDAWFDGAVQKMVSVSASMATAFFNNHRLRQLETMDAYPLGMEGGLIHEEEIKNQPLAFFDSRVWTVPDPVEVENYFVWRQKDAVRNSLSMHAQTLFSPKQLHGKSQSDLHEMIHQHDQNWNDLPDGFKRGRTIYKTRASGTGSTIDTPDFLKEREILTGLIPRIIYE